MSGNVTHSHKHSKSATALLTLFPTYNEYIVQYNKESSPSRRSIYESRLEKIQQHNQSPSGSFYRAGPNQFSDWSDEERASLFGLNKPMLHREMQENEGKYVENLVIPEKGFPTSWDWSKKGAVTPPKNQGSCGSCWSFAGTEAIESALFLATGKLSELSPQSFLDCTPNPNHCGGTGGCEGNTFDLLYKYAVNKSSSGKGFGGAVLASQYPYLGHDGKCHDSSVPTYANVESFADVPSNNYTALMAAVMKTPVAVGVAAMNWGDYMGGVYPSTLCDGDIDHAVLLVGWGTDPGLGDYWKIKNSWGTGWGENGYIRLQKNKDFCTVDSTPSDGFGCNNTTKKVKVCGACAIQYAPSFPTGVTLASQ
jgi:cathepsin L